MTFWKNVSSLICIDDEPKSGLTRDLGDCLQSRNEPFALPVILIRFYICKISGIL